MSIILTLLLLKVFVCYFFCVPLQLISTGYGPRPRYSKVKHRILTNTYLLTKGNISWYRQLYSSIDVMEDSVKITKLSSAEGWLLWKFQIRVIVNSFDLEGILSGEIPKPRLVKTSTETEEQARARCANEISAWRRADGKCQKIIVTSVDDGPLQCLINCQTANEMWNKLLSVYEQKTEASVHLLQNKFFSYSKSSSDDISTHISILQNLRNQLNSLGENISEGMLITKILMTLPSTYKHFYSAWDSVPEASKNLNVLTSRLLIEESRMQQVSSGVEAEENNALTARKFQKKFSKKPSGEKSVEQKFSKQNTGTKKVGPCFYCQKPGHFKRDCRKYKKDQEGAKSDSSNSSSTGQAFYSELLFTEKEEDQWFLDSGATDHMTGHMEWFCEYKQFDSPAKVTIGDGSVLLAEGSGRINISCQVKNKTYKNYLSNVLYVKDLKFNLFSCGAALDKGLIMKSDSKMCVFLKNNKVVCEGKRNNGLYHLKIKVLQVSTDVTLTGNTNDSIKNIEANATAVMADSIRVWHKRLAHQNIGYVRTCLLKHNIQVPDKDDTFQCDDCIIGKQSRKSFKTRTNISQNIGDLIYADLCGPIQKKSKGGSRYFLLCKDDYCRFRTVYFLKHKSEVKNKLKLFIKSFKTGSGFKIKAIQTDNGTEFLNDDVTRIFQTFGIQHRKTQIYSSPQNGKIERENRTIMDSARTMIHANKMDLSFWAEAVNTAVYTINLTGKSSVEGKCPYELFYNKMPDIKHLRVFGTKVYTHIPKEKRQKLDPRSESGIFVGYSIDKKGYRVYLEQKRIIIDSRDVIFKNECHNTVDVSLYESDLDIQHDTSQRPVADESEREEPRYDLRDRGQLRKPDRYAACTAKGMEPINYYDAINGENSHEWTEAMNDELNSLAVNNTWQLVDRPTDKNILNNSWVYKVKYASNGDVERYKARLVINGSRQQYGIDYNETFSPVVRFESIRALLAVAAKEKLKLKQFDIKTAFLNGVLEELIYMSQPVGYDDKSGRVCKLNKSLYGLKQSSRCWNQKFTEFLLRFNLTQSTADPCVFINHDGNDKIILGIYVDDGLVMSNSSSKIQSLLSTLQQEFEVKSNDLDYFLGIQIRKLNDGSLIIHQSNYAFNIVRRFNMQDAKELAIPFDRATALETESKPIGKDVPYRQAVGCLLFLSQVTRPDLSYAVSYVSRYLSNPTVAHWIMVKRIIRYINKTIDFGLYYKTENNSDFSVYTDADFAGDVQTRRSTSGNLFMLGSSTIAWQSQRQSTVSLSSCEAEYISAAESVKGIIWFKRLLQEITNNECIQPILYIDNQSAIRLVKNAEFHKRTKHIDVRHHFIREKYEDGVFQLQYKETKDQLADIFTKPLPKERFEMIRSAMNIHNWFQVCWDNS